MNAEDAVELDQLQLDLASSLVRAMEDEVSWWLTLELLVAHDSSGERSVIRYQSGDGNDRDLATDDEVKGLVSEYRERLDESVRRWRFSIDYPSGVYGLDTSPDQPWHGTLSWTEPTSSEGGGGS